MPVPKRKRSKARRDKRFANKGLKIKAFGSCNNCDEIINPHQICQGCGFYRGVKVLLTKNDRTERRGQVKKDKVEKSNALHAKVASGQESNAAQE